MALVVEDGTGKSDADSFVSLADAEIYHAARLHNSAWTGATDPTKEAALKWASRILARQDWKGLPATTTGALHWPRSYVLKDDPIDSEDYYDNASVPTFLKDATSEFAFRLIESDRGADAETKGIKSMKAGPLEMEFDVNDRNLDRLLPPEVRDMIEHALTAMAQGFGRVLRV